MAAASGRLTEVRAAHGADKACGPAAGGAHAAMPKGVRWALASALAIAFAGALYLIAARGEALIVDLAKLGRIFCF